MDERPLRNIYLLPEVPDEEARIKAGDLKAGDIFKYEKAGGEHIAIDILFDKVGKKYIKSKRPDGWPTRIYEGSFGWDVLVIKV